LGWNAQNKLSVKISTHRIDVKIFPNEERLVQPSHPVSDVSAVEKSSTPDKAERAGGIFDCQSCGTEDCQSPASATWHQDLELSLALGLESDERCELGDGVEIVRRHLYRIDGNLESRLHERQKFHDPEGVDNALLYERSVVCVRKLFAIKEVLGYVVLDDCFNLHSVIVL